MSSGASIELRAEVVADGIVTTLDDTATATEDLVIEKYDAAVMPGAAIAHESRFVVSEPDEAGFFCVSVVRAGSVVASGIEDDVFKGLASVVQAFLPPDHPKYKGD